MDNGSRVVKASDCLVVHSMAHAKILSLNPAWDNDEEEAV